MKLIISIVTTIIFVSCSNLTGPGIESLTIKKTSETLLITNHSDKTIFLFLVEREFAALINWSPQFNNPVSKGSSYLISYEDIFNGKVDAVKDGDEVIINYWDDSDSTNPEIYSKVVKL